MEPGKSGASIAVFQFAKVQRGEALLRSERLFILVSCKRQPELGSYFKLKKRRCAKQSASL
jgi:hypothetical protein